MPFILYLRSSDYNPYDNYSDWNYSHWNDSDWNGSDSYWNDSDSYWNYSDWNASDWSRRLSADDPVDILTADLYNFTDKEIQDIILGKIMYDIIALRDTLGTPLH